MRKKKTNGSGQGQEAARLPGGAGLNIEKRLSYRFSILSDRMIRAVADMYGPRFGLLLSGWKAMATIGRYSRVSAKDVCAHTTVAPDKITRAVDRGELEWVPDPSVANPQHNCRVLKSQVERLRAMRGRTERGT